MLPLLLAADVFPEVLPSQWLKSLSQFSPFAKTQRHRARPTLLTNRFFLHALNGPLTSLSINLELAIASASGDKTTTQAHLNQAITSLKHLHNLFHLLHTESNLRTQTFKAESALKEVVIQHHQPHRQRHVTSALNLPPNLQVKGNVFYLQEALACLINNAFEAYPTQRAPKHVLVAAYATRTRLVIYIGDVGQGMDWLMKRLAFFKGFTSKKQGSGLGLILAKQLIEDQLHGELEMASFNKIGTLFLISLPLKP